MLRGDAFHLTVGEEGKKPPKDKIIRKREEAQETCLRRMETSEIVLRSEDSALRPEPSMQGLKQSMLPCTELQELHQTSTSLGATGELSRSQ